MASRPAFLLLAPFGLLSACEAGKVGLPEDDTVGTAFIDDDGDGFPAGADCDDGDAAVFPGAVEVCNGTDDDCDGDTDPATSAGASTWYADADDDGFGEEATATLACDQPDGAVADGTDCDDQESAVFPGAYETCDGRDDDCDALTDDADPDVTGQGSWYPDADGDGYGADDTAPLATCEGPDGYADNAEDCDDSDASRNPVGWPCTTHLSTSDAAATLTGISAGDFTGWSVWGGDDYNLDGTADYLVGAYYRSSAKGAVYVQYGPLAGSASLSTADLTFSGTTSSSLGYWTGPAGDLDGDGHADLAFMGAGAGYYAYNTPVSAGLSISDADVHLSAEVSGDPMGNAAGGLDVNGDGQDDVVVADNNWPAPTTYTGSIYVLFGPVAGSASLSTADLILRGETAGDNAGGRHGLSPGGDMDGDGVDDLLVGSDYSDGGGADSGSAYVVLGGSSGVGSLSDADAIVRGVSAGQYIGEAVAGDGDADGDGYNDLLIGSARNGTTYQGAVWLMSGPLSGALTTASATATLSGAMANDNLGGSLGALSDLDADGQGDLVVGALFDYSCGDTTGTGSVFVYYGPVSGALVCDAADVKITGETPNGRLSQGLASIGDVDGDGLGDLFVGAYYDGSAGNAYLFTGSAF